jgi:hypothetical protein
VSRSSIVAPRWAGFLACSKIVPALIVRRSSIRPAVIVDGSPMGAHGLIGFLFPSRHRVGARCPHAHQEPDNHGTRHSAANDKQ